MDIRRSRSCKKAEGCEPQKQAQNDPPRMSAASGGPDLSACSHVHPDWETSHTNIGIPEADTIRDYTYHVEREARPFAALFWFAEAVTPLTFPPWEAPASLDVTAGKQQS
jgi:hypothetical protein